MRKPYVCKKRHDFIKIIKHMLPRKHKTPRNSMKFCWVALVTAYQPGFPFCDSYIK